MKPFAAFSAVFLLVLAVCANAQAVPAVTGTTPHYAVTIAGSLTTQIDTTGTSSTSHAVAVTTASILKAVFLTLTGTAAVAKTSDLDLVITLPSLEVDVINKATHQIITTIAQVGAGAATNGLLVTVSRTGAKLTSISNDYEFALPGVTSREFVNLVAHVNEPVTSGAVASSFTFTFIGGNNGSNSPENVFQGTIRRATKVYIY